MAKSKTKKKQQPSSSPAKRQGGRRAFTIIVSVLVVLIVAALGFLVRQIRKPVEPRRSPTNRMTDVAPEMRAPDLTGEHPSLRLEKLKRARAAGGTGMTAADPSRGAARERPPLPRVKVILPNDGDPRNPPQFTRPLTRNLPPMPPDHRTPPAVEIDPRTGRAWGEPGPDRGPE